MGIEIVRLLVFCSVLVFNLQAFAFTKDDGLPPYTSEQAEAGKVIYQKNCLVCHGENLNDGAAPPAAGDVFYSKWGGRPAQELFQYLKKSMPIGSQGVLTDDQYIELLAYMFQGAGFPSSDQALSPDSTQLSETTLPIPASGLAEKEVIDIPPMPNLPANPLDNISRVTDAVLTEASPENWLMWRRTYDAKGFSPLKDITADNVRGLQVAWAWNMPAGRNISTPLVHEGVMFMYGAGSRVFAFDAKTGDILWRYEREKTWNANRGFGPRSIAIYQDMVLLTTDDGNVVALAIKTGEVIWDQSVLEGSMYFSGGVLAANGKVLLGTATATASSKNFIIALDALTGEEKWRFYTLEKPGERAIDSWNGVPQEKRQGAGTWVPASYDAESKLVFFGTGNTYRPQLLAAPPKEGASNDGLYTNSTLALDIDTGELAWYFQHLPNDQWNYDWAFERTIMALPIEGQTENVVLTAGKQGIFDSMRVENGQYLFSVETGVQNVITAIDPETGDKTINPALLPINDSEILPCPDSVGIRNWQPTSFNKDTGVLFMAHRESCMKVRSPMRRGDTPHGKFGQMPVPLPDSDGHFGGMIAVSLETRETLWETRQRATVSTGILATAGDLLFFGSRDRSFVAYDQAGKELWRVRLNGVPVGGPISFSVGDKQYIAVTTGDSVGFGEYNFGENSQNPGNDIATIWVFELR